MASDGCPVAKTVIEKFYSDILYPQRARLVCDCVYKENIRSTTGFLGSNTAAKNQWRDMVARRKELWSGTKS